MSRVEQKSRSVVSWECSRWANPVWEDAVAAVAPCGPPAGQITGSPAPWLALCWVSLQELPSVTESLLTQGDLSHIPWLIRVGSRRLLGPCLTSLCSEKDNSTGPALEWSAENQLSSRWQMLGGSSPSPVQFPVTPHRCGSLRHSPVHLFNANLHLRFCFPRKRWAKVPNIPRDRLGQINEQLYLQNLGWIGFLLLYLFHKYWRIFPLTYQNLKSTIVASKV